MVSPTSIAPAQTPARTKSQMLSDSRQRLAHDIALRPTAAAQISNDEAALNVAQKAKADAEAEVARLQQIAQQKYADNKHAEAYATGYAETNAANEMERLADQAANAASTAQGNANSLQSGIDSARLALAKDQQFLSQLDAQIVQLRTIIAHDQQVRAH